MVDCQKILTRNRGEIMGRETEEGRHEGGVVHLFADGMSGGSWGGGPIATTAADGTRLDASDWQTRADADVVAWQVLCTDLVRSGYPECWRGPTWTRVATAAEQDLARRRIYCADSMLPGELEDVVMRDWEVHIAPHQRVRPVELAAEEVAKAQEALTDAVRTARAEGASWAAIGAAAGITRQSAHTRWAGIVNDGRTGDEEVDRLIDAADREYSESWNLTAVNVAENVVADARLTDIAEQQKAARRRWSAAQGLLTKAEKSGDAAKIADARQHEIEAYREFDAISQAVITEGFGIVSAGSDRLGRQLDQLKRNNAAGDAVLEELRKLPRSQ
jgi:hypothetical protein